VDLIQHSDARRTTETCRLLLDELRGAGSEQIDVRAVGQIYEAEVADLIEVIHGFPISARTAMLVGHNPGVQDLVLHLARPDDGASTAQVSAKFPTSGLAVLAIAGPWSELGPGQATVERFVVPRG
jgi:phosphohistidine phosphatase